MSPTFAPKFAAIAVSSWFLCACAGGEIVSFGRDSDGDGVPDSRDNDNLLGDQHNELAFTCNESLRATPTLRRLSRIELENTLRAVLRVSSTEATATQVMREADSAIDGYPKDSVTKDKPFSTMDQALSEGHVDAMVRIGTTIGKALTSSPQRINELLGSCATARNANAAAMASCIDGFIGRFGKRLLSKKLTDKELAFFREVYAASGSKVDAAGLADVIAVMINAPGFAYRVELGDKPVGNSQELFQLTDYEIASRLAFRFWQMGPDDELLAAAERGELRDDRGFEKVLDRVLDDPRTGATLAQFAREWLGLDRMRPLDQNNGNAVYDAFTSRDKPTATLKEEMIRDVTDSFVYHAVRDQGSLADWVQSPYSFASSAQLAAIYETPTWDGKSEPPRFPQGERAGLITRAGLLATGTVSTSPIMKGVLIRERLLCDHIPPPPANAAKLPEASGEKTTRELVEALTEIPGTPCAACHVTQINPLGFATEGFDSLGRPRTKQDLYGSDGKVVLSKPIDTRSVPNVRPGDDTPSSGAADLTSLLIESGKVEACFAREWVRYTAARKEDDMVDGCELETVRSVLSNGGSLREALRRYAMMPQFRQRYLPRG